MPTSFSWSAPFKKIRHLFRRRRRGEKRRLFRLIHHAQFSCSWIYLIPGFILISLLLSIFMNLDLCTNFLYGKKYTHKSAGVKMAIYTLFMYVENIFQEKKYTTFLYSCDLLYTFSISKTCFISSATLILCCISKYTTRTQYQNIYYKFSKTYFLYKNSYAMF